MKTLSEAIQEAIKDSISDPVMYFTVVASSDEFSDGEITGYGVGVHDSKDITVYPSECIHGVYRNGIEVDILQCNFNRP